MNGFIYWESEAHRLSPAGLRRRVGKNEELHVDSHPYAKLDKHLMWGDAIGDVHNHAQSRNSLLILNGYITEISKGPEILKQEHAAEWLLKAIEADTSNAALSALLARLHGSFGIV